MFSLANKTTSTPALQAKASGASFFRKAGEESFFGNTKEAPAFFGAPVQTKLTVSSPDDPHEKEADAVADKVMRMPEPVHAAAPIAEQKEEKLQRKEEEELRAKQEAPFVNKIYCKAEQEDKLHAKRSNNIRPQTAAGMGMHAIAGMHGGHIIDRKNISLYHSDTIQRSGRGPPATSIPFEQSLAHSKGGGSGLPEGTRQSMEGRFNADFSGVRIHTDDTAAQLTSSVQAKAFAHGNDIYFNKDQFAPQSNEGGTLLAHELTHTIQQGGAIQRRMQNQAAPVAAPAAIPVSDRAKENNTEKDTAYKDKKNGVHKKRSAAARKSNLANAPPKGRPQPSPMQQSTAAKTVAAKQATRNKQQIKAGAGAIKKAPKPAAAAAPKATIKKKALAANTKLAASDIKATRKAPAVKAKSPGAQTVLEALMAKSTSARQSFINNVAQKTSVVQAALDMHLQNITTTGANQEAALKNLFGQARGSINARLASAKSQVASHAATQKSTLSGGQSSALENVTTTFTSAHDGVNTMSNTYADKSIETANNAATSLQAGVQSKVNEANEIGNQKAAVNDSDADLREAKSKVAHDIAADTAGKMSEGIDDAMNGLRATGPNTATEFRSQGAQAAEQLMGAKSQADTQVAAIFTNAISGIDVLSNNAGTSLSNTGTQIMQQLSAFEAKVLTQLAQTITQKQDDFNKAGQTIMAAFKQQSEKAIAGGDSQVDTIGKQIAAAPIREQQTAEGIAFVDKTISPAFAKLNEGLNTGTQTVTDTISKKATEVMSALTGVTTSLSPQINKFASQSGAQIQQTQSQATSQLTQTTSQTMTGGTSVVSQVATGVGDQVIAIDKNFSQGLAGYSTELQNQVTAGQQKSTEPIGTLPGRITEAQQKAQERASRSWLSNQLHDAAEILSDPGFWAGLAIGLLLAVVFILLIAGTALTGGALLLVLVAGAAVIGAIAAAVGSIVGQATDHSFFKGWDSSRINWGEVGKSALFGAAAGAAIAVIAFIAVEGFGVAAAGFGMVAIMSLSSAAVGIVQNVINGEDWDKGLLFNLALGGLLAWLGGKASVKFAKPGVPPELPPGPKPALPPGTPEVPVPKPVPVPDQPEVPAPPRPTPVPDEPVPPGPKPVDPPDPVPPGPKPVDPDPPGPKPGPKPDPDPEPPGPKPPEPEPDPPGPKPPEPEPDPPGPKPPLSPEEIGRAIGEDVSKLPGGKRQAIAARVSALGMSQEDAAIATRAASQRAFGRANIVRLNDGRMAVISVQMGPNQPIFIITPEGIVIPARATLSPRLAPTPGVDVTDIVLETGPGPTPPTPDPPGPKPPGPNPPEPPGPNPPGPEPPGPKPPEPEPPGPTPPGPVAEGRPIPARPTEPPVDASTGQTDFSAWETRLRAKGVKGLPESEFTKKMNEAKAGNQDTQAELRLAERYADAGYEVEIVRPTSETPGGETPVIDEPRSPDLRIKLPGETETARVDVKFREPGKPITKSNLNTQIDSANDQIRVSKEGHGDVIVDGSEAANGGLNTSEVERYMNGKMRGNRNDPAARLSKLDYLEIIYPDGPVVKRTFMVRTADGNVNGPFTEVIKR